MFWYELAQNPESLLSLYEVVPELDNVGIRELILNHDGPRLSLKIDLPSFPDKPPSRWDSQCNLAIATLDFWGIEAVTLQGWSTTVKGNIQIELVDNNKIGVSFQGIDIDFRAVCEFYRIDRVVGVVTES